MSTPSGAMLALVLAAGALSAQEPVARATPATSFAAIQADYKQAVKAFNALYEAAKTAEERQKCFEKYPKGEVFAPRVAAIVKTWPDDPVAVEATTWLTAIQSGDGKTLDELLGVLLEHQIESPNLAGLCGSLQYVSSPESIAFLRAAKAKNPSHDVQGRACYALAQILVGDSRLVEKLRDEHADPDLVQWLTESRGADAVEELRHADPAELQKASEALLEEVVASYGDLKAYHKTLGEQAKGDLFEMRNLVPGKPAPEIEGTDVDGVAFKLSEYRGKVVFLDFWGYW